MHICKRIPKSDLNFAFGVSNRINIYVRIHDISISDDEDGYCVLDIDNHGVKHRATLTDEQQAIVDYYKQKYNRAKEKNLPGAFLSEEDVVMLAKTFGMPINIDFRSLVYDILD